MKLVEILARGWRDWPEKFLRVSQLSNSKLIIDGQVSECVYKLSSDWETAVVTHPQWQAERERIAKMDALIKARDNPPVIEYEQQLWDRVAAQLIVKFSQLGASKSWNSSNCMEAMEVADAFMAERAKRLHKHD